MSEEEILTKRQKRALAKEEKRHNLKRQATFDQLKNAFLVLLGVFVLAFIAVKAWKWFKTPAPEVAGEAVEVNDSDWTKGASNASVVLIEYSDFQCPACALYYPILASLNQSFPDDLLIVYRHFPLVSIHKNAVPAAWAAEAAGSQDKFWEMHDKLFDNQKDWSEEKNPKDKFTQYAKDLVLDEEKFLNDYQSKETENKVLKDLFVANSLKLNSTPTFFLNGRKIQAGSLEDFKSLVEKELADTEQQ